MTPEGKKAKIKLEPKHWFYVIVCSAVAIFIIVLFLIPELMPEKPTVTEVEYDYFKFKKAGPVWETQLMYKDRLLQPSFRFLPGEVENVPITGEIDDDFGNDVIYLTFDPLAEKSEFQTLTIAVSEMGMNIVTGLEKKIEAACTRNETEDCLTRPIVTCEDDKSVVFFNSTGEPEVILKGNCIEFRGKGFDLLKSVDKVLYKWYGIIKNTISADALLPS